MKFHAKLINYSVFIPMIPILFVILHGFSNISYENETKQVKNHPTKIELSTYNTIKIMFSGIVEECATVVAIEKEQENVHFTLRCSFVSELKIDQSVSHNGVCLTVVHIIDGTYTVTAMRETLERSNLGDLQIGDEVNVERSMMMNGRLDGHIVQGHVDQTALCTDVEDADGSWTYTFRYDYDPEMARRGYTTVDKGSVSVNGVSLTVCNPTSGSFQVNIIPYTYDNTNFHSIRPGTRVNLEFDILGKYICQYLAQMK